MKYILQSIVCFALASISNLSAQTQTIAASGYNTITDNPYFTPGHTGTTEQARELNEPSSSFIGGLTDPPQQGFGLIQFDLSAYAGATVVGDATLSQYLFAGDTSAPSGVDVSESLVAWDPTTVTFDSFIGPDPTTDFSSKVGGVLDSETSFTLNADNSWTIPAAVIQGWIDNPGSNDGLFVYAVGGTEQFYENPTLSFTVTSAPEPSTLFMLCGGMMALVLSIKRKGSFLD